MSDIKISTVELNIGDTSIKLTLEQIRELKEILAKAFPEPVIPIVVREKEYIPWPYSYPWHYTGPYWSSSTIGTAMCISANETQPALNYAN